MGDVDPLIITYYRLSISAIILLPFLIQKTDHIPLKVNSFLLIISAGFFLALHFYTWITSLQMTTVGNSIFLESTHPLFAWILSIFFLKEKTSLKFLPVILFGMTGILLMVSADLTANFNALSGDLLAISSAVFVALYLIMARKNSGAITLIPYLIYVYSAAALFVLIFLLIRGINFWELSLEIWLLLFLLAAGPNLIGHSIFNWAARKMPVYIVNSVILGEAVLATFYAVYLLNEEPGLLFYPGALLILLSVGYILYLQKPGSKKI
jgi:drug/metabolite transporter (DMT)-like permease